MGSRNFGSFQNVRASCVRLDIPIQKNLRTKIYFVTKSHSTVQAQPTSILPVESMAASRRVTSSAQASARRSDQRQRHPRPHEAASRGVVAIPFLCKKSRESPTRRRGLLTRETVNREDKGGKRSATLQTRVKIFFLLCLLVGGEDTVRLPHLVRWSISVNDSDVEDCRFTVPPEPVCANVTLQLRVDVCTVGPACLVAHLFPARPL